VVDPGRGERCDDGNVLDGDGCDSSCGACSGPTAFAATWDAIQTNVFERTCTTCHGASASGGLDLRPPGTYERIVGVAAPDAPGLSYIHPGDRTTSFLWLKLEKGTTGGHEEVSGPGMPVGPPLPADVVDALGRWIDAGAPATGVVAGSEALTRACP
jgi:cysteine-rich repeat protein